MYHICVTMVATNESETVKTCLTSLYEDIKDSNLNIGVVLVDNASTDGTQNMLKTFFPNVLYIRQQENEGFGKSHNKAMEKVEADYYFVLNPDTIFPQGQGLLQHLYQFMEDHPTVGMAGPKIVYPDGSLQYSCFRFPTFTQPIYSRTKLGKRGNGKVKADHFLMKDFDHNQTRPVDWIMGSAMFVRGRAIKQVGMFDDRFWMYAEDSDWCRRMWEAHRPVYYVHDVYIKHVHGRASAKVPGIINALVKNRYARVHLISWMKYFWKWRGNYKFYATKF